MEGPPDSAQDLAAWDANAARYAEAVGPNEPVAARFRTFLHASLGDVDGLAVLDLGCGNGWLSAEIQAQGGQVVGIDGSAQLLAIARAQHPEVEFLRADLTGGLPDLGPRRFDRVLAQMVLMDMATLDALLRDIGHSLLPNGRFIFTVPHPAFFGAPGGGDAEGAPFVAVHGYLDHEVRWITTFGGHRHYHRPLGWYVDLLADSGMAVVRLFEPRTPPEDGEGTTGGAPAIPSVPSVLGMMAIPVTPGLALPVGRPSPLADEL